MLLLSAKEIERSGLTAHGLMSTVQQTPEKPPRSFTSFISPPNHNKKRAYHHGKDSCYAVQSPEKKRDDVLIEPSDKEYKDHTQTDTNLKCLEVVLPNYERRGVNVLLSSTVGEFLEHCMEDFKKDGASFQMKSEDDTLLDLSMPSADLDFDATYYIVA